MKRAYDESDIGALTTAVPAREFWIVTERCNLDSELFLLLWTVLLVFFSVYMYLVGLL